MYRAKPFSGHFRAEKAFGPEKAKERKKTKTIK